MGGNLPAVDLGTGRTATAVSAGAGHTCAVLDDGSVKCWGINSSGQLGIGDTAPRGDGPDEMGDSLTGASLGAGRTATAVSSGSSHTCALLDDGAVKCWGLNNAGQLGLGNTSARGDGPNEMGDDLPAVNLGTGRTATAISAGDRYTCALLDDASVKCWGLNSAGQLGLGDTASRGDQAGELGDSLSAVSLGTGRTATAISAGAEHVCAVLDNASVKCWGFNGSGQLGAGDTSGRGDDPNEMGDFNGGVDLGPGLTATTVSAGGSHTCALLNNAKVKCWGSGLFGALGGFDATNRGDGLMEMGEFLLAVDVGTNRTVTAVTTGNEFTCARLDNAAVKCWGNNSFGSSGLGDTATRGDNSNEMGNNLPPVFLETATGISGVMTDSASGAPLAGWVAVLRTSDFSIAGGAVADPMGNFNAVVPAGSYYLYLVDPAGTHTPGFSGAPTTFTVVTGVVTTASPTMVPTRGSVAGTVIEDNTFNAISGAWAISLNGTTAVLETVVVANGAGQFSSPGLSPGNHFVGWIDPAGGHVTEFSPNSPSVPGATPLTVTAGAATLGSGSLAAKSVAPGGATLSGTITEAGSGAPLGGVHVIALSAADFGMVRGGVTNAMGQYSLSVPPSGYKLAFVDSTGRHNLEWHDNLPANGIASAATVSAPAVTNAVLDANTGSMAGTITQDPSGSPIQGAWVLAIGPNGVAGGAITAVNGTYNVTGLAPGTYRAGFLDPVGGGLLEYANNSPDFAGASPFPVTAGTTATPSAALAFGGNDAFDSARLLTGASPTVTGSNVGATVEVGEPAHFSTGGASVWYRWTAPSNGIMTMTTCGSSFDTLLAAYTGNSLATLTTAARGDDNANCGGGDLTKSSITFAAHAGRTYRIAVDGFRTAGVAETGNITLTGSFT
jgi:alpha-tubulin suppressor-like RCC1 family protein